MASAADAVVELDIQAAHDEDNGLRESFQHDFSLPQADGGRQAYLFLAGAFAVETLIWGFPFAFGVFQEYYATHEPFRNHSSGVSAIGTTALGLMYLGSPFTFVLLQFYPQIRRICVSAGLAILTVALLASSFCSTIVQLILTQGILYAIGGSLVYCPVILFVDEWFIRRKGIAFGIIWAGTGFSGVTVPYLLSFLLTNYGFRTTLRIWSLILFLLIPPLTYTIKPRLPLSRTRLNRKLDLSFMRLPHYYIHEAATLLQGLGFFAPGIYLPTYAKSLGLSSAAATATLALQNGAAVFGCLFVGALVDRFHVTTVIGICTVGAVFSVFVLWGLSASLPLLLLFSAAYGFFAGGFSSNWTGMVAEIRKRNRNADAGLMLGVICFGRGIGSVVCGPLSEVMIRTNGEGEDLVWSNAKGGYGTGYGPLIVFTGVSALLGGISLAARGLRWL